MGRVGNMSRALRGVGRAVTGTAEGAFRKHPVASSLTAAGGLAAANSLGLEVFKRLAVGVTDTDESQRARADEMFQLEQRVRAQRQVREMERQRRDMAMQANLQVIATQAPDVYNQVLAGRPLPRGAKVFAGRPRRDLLEELAVAMSDGAFPVDGGGAGPMGPMAASMGPQSPMGV